MRRRSKLARPNICRFSILILLFSLDDSGAVVEAEAGDDGVEVLAQAGDEGVQGREVV